METTSTSIPNVFREGAVSRRAIVHRRPKLTWILCINILVNLLYKASFLQVASISGEKNVTDIPKWIRSHGILVVVLS
jgi:hypothetical protein